jgi:hypothetical protein
MGNRESQRPENRETLRNRRQPDQVAIDSLFPPPGFAGHPPEVMR